MPSYSNSDAVYFEVGEPVYGYFTKDGELVWLPFELHDPHPVSCYTIVEVCDAKLLKTP